MAANSFTIMFSFSLYNFAYKTAIDTRPSLLRSLNAAVCTRQLATQADVLVPQLSNLLMSPCMLVVFLLTVLSDGVLMQVMKYIN